jgi:hypothetical protein
MSEKSPVLPIAASAISFGATHLALRHGPVNRRLTKMYASRKEKGLLQPNANPPLLAAQAGSRILNEIHNLMVVCIVTAGLRSTTSRAHVPCLVSHGDMRAGPFQYKASV